MTKALAKLLKSPEPVRWIFHGDSITHGAVHTMGWRSYSEIFAERIRWELKRSGDLVLNAAYSGFTTEDLLASFDMQVVKFEPHVVFLMIGMNDCGKENGKSKVSLAAYKKNLRELVARTRSINGAIAVLQTTCPIQMELAPNRRLHPRYMDAVREIAASTESPLIDHHLHWTNEIDRRVHRLAAWMSDAIHPNELGHRVFAETIFKSLRIFDPESATGRLYYI
jgi:acyl-CoA thioesterase-1